ncbi:glutamyl-tRNA reductase [Chloroflexota bacterium]
MKMSEQGSIYYPISLNIDNRKCVVIGGGVVALRKVGALLECRANVEVISQEISPELGQLEEGRMIQVIHRDYVQGDLKGAVLAVAATDDNSVNQKVSTEARKRGVLINVVDDPEKSDFIVPSQLRRGTVTIAVSTGGSSPALARKIRSRIEKSFGVEYGSLAALISEVRSELKQRKIKVGSDAWQRALDLNLLTALVQDGRSEEARDILLSQLEKAGRSKYKSKSGGMQLCVVGVNHSTSPIELREKLAIGTNCLDDALVSLRSYINHGIILSTCNRTEVYTTARYGRSARKACIDFLKAYSNVSEADLLPNIYTYKDRQAIEYLFSVASGLDSMIIGEHEILGQVGQALEAAERVKMVDLPLRNLFRNAVRVGRRVREETLISRNALSVSSVAVDLAMRVVGDIGDSRILVIGAGEAGRLVAKAARERGVRQIAVISRSQEKADTLATALGGRPVTLNDLQNELGSSDIVVSCTGAPHLILDVPLVEEAMKDRPDLPLVIIDIAVPRDVEAEVAKIENVFLYNIDNLNEVSESNRELREREVGRAAEITGMEADKFYRWWRSLEVKPTISALVTKAERIRQRQLDATVKKLKGLSDDERVSLEEMTRAIVRKLLHDPIELMKENAHSDEVYNQAMRELFRLEEEESE